MEYNQTSCARFNTGIILALCLLQCRNLTNANQKNENVCILNIGQTHIR